MWQDKNKKKRVKFASDNVTGACPEVLMQFLKLMMKIELLMVMMNYQRSAKKFSRNFEKEVIVFPTASGTAANALALSTMTPSLEIFTVTELSHINVDECGAPEFYTGGAKLVNLDGINGKIIPEELDDVNGKGIVHHTQPSSVSITQLCEANAAYQLDEIKKISEVAHKHKLNIHMDGARFANALVSLNCSAAEMTWKSGIDVSHLGQLKMDVCSQAIILIKT